MNRYEELEKLYYKKLYTKIFLWFLGVVIGIGGIFYVYDIYNKTKVKKEKTKEIKKTEEKLKKNAKNKRDANTSQKEVKNTTSHSNILNIKFLLPPIKELNKSVSQSKQVKASHSQSKDNSKTEKTKKTLSSGKKNFVIKEKKVSLKDLINKFNKNPDFNLALIIAKQYLSDNNLSKAQEWSLKANNLKPQNPESWILFADIFIKKKNIKKAKEILKFYLDSYGKNDTIENKLRNISNK